MEELTAEFYCYAGNFVARNQELISILFLTAIIAGVVAFYITEEDA